LQPDFEYAVLAMSGWAEVDGVEISPGSMLYLGCERRDLPLRSEPGTRVLLLGGEPFDEQIVMWWNFVARTSDEILEARELWENGTRFGSVADAGPPLAAPPPPVGRLKPGGSVR
jgi:redox-sensitive bicupin YhaK (pirin superfamily)